MASITDIRTAGTDLTLQPKPIYEPLNAPPLLNTKLARFGDDYNVSTNSNLYKFLLAVCGESGAGQINKQMLYPRLQSSMQSTQFLDLDRIYGSPIGLPRNIDEIYEVDPRNESLTQGQWADVRIKDAQYRARCLTWMRAIIEGPTIDGIKLAAEAGCGIECDVFEQYKYIENLFSDTPAPMENWGVTNSRQEFVIIPQAPSITQAQHRQIIRLVDQIKPVNTIATIAQNEATRTQQNVQAVSATTEGFNILRLVTGSANVNWPPVDPAEGLWITTQEEEAPTFAYMSTQESITYLTVVGVIASTTQIGNFNQMQRSLFQQLNQIIDPFFSFDPSQSYSKSFAPIQLMVPWTASS